MYNNDMTTVIIQGPEQAILAGTWAKKHIKNNWDFDMESTTLFGNNPTYAFKFSNSKDAIFFSLKWKQ